MSAGTRAESAEVIDPDECWAVLESTALGRLAVRAGDDIDLVPVNYLVSDRLVYFRSAPGSKMVELTREPRVAFEADGTSGGLRWSVSLKGTAHRLEFDSEIEASRIQRLRSLDPADKWNYVRITPHAISGRRFVPAG